MDLDTSLQRLAQMLYEIYVETTKERQISENNYQITKDFLRTNEFEETFIVDECTKKESRSCTCEASLFKKQDDLESSIANKIETVVKKAQSIRLSDENLKRTKSKLSNNNNGNNIKTTNSKKSINVSKLPQINKSLSNSAQIPKKPLKYNLPKETKGKPAVARSNTATNMRLRGGGELIKTNQNTFYKVVEHSTTCPLNKDFQNRSTSSLKSSVQLFPASLKEMRLTPDLQKLLKLYYHFIEEKEKTVVKSRSKSTFISKLNTINQHRWNTFQHKDEYPLGNLKQLINAYNAFYPMPLRCSRTCYYSDAKVLIALQSSNNEMQRITTLQDIFFFIQKEILINSTLSKLDKTQIAAFYKCIMSLVNIYDSGYSKNNVVLKI